MNKFYEIETLSLELYNDKLLSFVRLKIIFMSAIISGFTYSNGGILSGVLFSDPPL